MAQNEKKKRTAPGKAGTDVLKEYNHRCAICGVDRPQIHHIDEDPSNQDPLNLLPLCPNCHLSDQHNPTARPDPRLLALFRKYKDPTILSPQFLPLFKRLMFLENVQGQSLEELTKLVSELLAFVAELEMGSFYAREMDTLLTAAADYPLSEGGESPERQGERERAWLQRQMAYWHQLNNAKPKVLDLAVELLRYQSWRSPGPEKGDTGH